MIGITTTTTIIISILLWKKLWQRQIKSLAWALPISDWSRFCSRPVWLQGHQSLGWISLLWCKFNQGLCRFQNTSPEELLSWKLRRLILLYAAWAVLQEKCQVSGNTERKGVFQGKTDHSYKESDGQHLTSLWSGCMGCCVNYKGMTNFLLCSNLSQSDCFQLYWRRFPHLN